MTQRPTADFTQVLKDSGVPTTADDFEAKLKENVIAAGSQLSNDSQMSPFWSWVRSAVVTPATWLIQTLLAGYVMPNMFVATAERWSLELKAWELNVTIKEATKTTGRIALTKENADDATTIAAGSIIQTLPIDDVTYQVIVKEETVINAGVLVGYVIVEAVEAGEAYNLPAGYFNILPEELPGIVSAVNEPDWITALGANEETDEEIALRLQNAFTSSGSWHIDDAYRAIIASVAGIRSDNIFFENTGHITPGSANAYIVMEVGETPQSILDGLNQHIQTDGHHGHGDILTCLAINDSLHNIKVDVILSTNLDTTSAAQQLLEVENRIRASFRESAAFDEMTRAKPVSRFSVSQLSTEIHQNMALVESIKITIDGEVHADIVSEYTQPRINSITVQQVA